MTISLCIIFKNNQETIANCLSSVEGLVDEIIAVNTGSTDNSLEIVKKFTDNVYDYKWDENFSNAKNFAITKATKDWILALDADETISKKDFEKIKSLTQEDYLGFSLIQRNYSSKTGSFNWISNKNDDYEENKVSTGYVPRRMIRLFKNLPEIRFQGAVHDSPELSILKLGRIKETSIPIHHYGLLDRSPEITKFYIDIEKKNLRNDFFQDYQIGVQLHTINNLDEALDWLNKSIEKNPIFALSWLELGMILIKKNNLKEAENALKKAESLEEHPMIYDHLGILYGKLEEPEKAIAYFKKALSLSPENADFHFNLGLTYHYLDKRYEASIEFKKAVELNSEYSKIINFN